MSVTFTDNGDGTGITATVTGATGTTTVYTAPFSGVHNLPSNWTSGGSRVGDGTIAISVATGHYFCYSQHDSDPPTVPVYVHATNSTQSVHYRCATAIQALIQSLGLTSIDSANIIVRKLDSDRGVDDGTYSLPMIVVSTIGLEQNQPATNERDDVGYPVMVTILAADNQDLSTNHDKYLRWREQIARAFRNQNLSAVPEIYTARIEPGPIVSPTAFWDRNTFHSALVVRCMSREVRGV